MGPLWLKAPQRYNSTCVKISFQTQIITIVFGLALLIFLGYAAEASSTSVSLFCSSLSLALFVLVYYFLNRLIAVQRDISERKLALSALQKSKDELAIRVADRTDELSQANDRLQRELLERERAKEALRQAEEKYRSIFENAIEGIFQTTWDGRYLTANPMLARIYGYSSPKELIANICDLGRQIYVDANRRAEFIRLLQKHDIVSEFESQVYRQDGKVIWISEQARAVRNSSGVLLYYEGTVFDITERKQSEEERALSERRWRTLLENVRLVVVGLDCKGLVEYVNPFFLELVGYTREEVLGKDWFGAFVPPHQKQRVQESFLEFLQQEFHRHYQNSILTKSGEERIIAWNNTLLRNLQGDVISTLSIGEDITERYAIERMKDEFISVVSHELRTPLTSIHGALNLLSSGLVDTQSDKGRRVIEIAAESADRLVRLVNDILELERLESGKISLLKQPCNAADLMTKATDMMQVMANRAGIPLSLSSQAIQFDADPDRIIQVLTNLLGNAIKFSPKGSTVCLSVELQLTPSPHASRLNGGNPRTALAPHPTVLFQVKDQGRGIPGDKIESIFERFHQVDASDSRKKGGTGLGLAICRSIVQQHGGRIWVESTLGLGSSFYFSLPLAM